MPKKIDTKPIPENPTENPVGGGLSEKFKNYFDIDPSMTPTDNTGIKSPTSAAMSIVNMHIPNLNIQKPPAKKTVAAKTVVRKVVKVKVPANPHAPIQPVATLAAVSAPVTSPIVAPASSPAVATAIPTPAASPIVATLTIPAYQMPDFKIPDNVAMSSSIETMFANVNNEVGLLEACGEFRKWVNDLEKVQNEIGREIRGIDSSMFDFGGIFGLTSGNYKNDTYKTERHAISGLADRAEDKIKRLKIIIKKYQNGTSEYKLLNAALESIQVMLSACNLFIREAEEKKKEIEEAKEARLEADANAEYEREQASRARELLVEGPELGEDISFNGTALDLTTGWYLSSSESTREKIKALSIAKNAQERFNSDYKDDLADQANRDLKTLYDARLTFLNTLHDQVVGVNLKFDQDAFGVLTNKISQIGTAIDNAKADNIVQVSASTESLAGDLDQKYRAAITKSTATGSGKSRKTQEEIAILGSTADITRDIITAELAHKIGALRIKLQSKEAALKAEATIDKKVEEIKKIGTDLDAAFVKAGNELRAMVDNTVSEKYEQGLNALNIKVLELKRIMFDARNAIKTKREESTVSEVINKKIKEAIEVAEKQITDSYVSLYDKRLDTSKHAGYIKGDIVRDLQNKKPTNSWLAKDVSVTPFFVEPIMPVIVRPVATTGSAQPAHRDDRVGAAPVNRPRPIGAGPIGKKRWLIGGGIAATILAVVAATLAYKTAKPIEKVSKVATATTDETPTPVALMAKQPATADPMDALRDALAKKLESSATVVRSATAPVAVSPTPPTVAPAPATPTVSTPIAPTAKVMPPTLTRENLGERLRRSMPAGTIGYETMTMSEMAKIGGQYTNEYALLRSPIVRDGKMLEVGKNNNGQSVGVSILSVIARIHNKTGIDFQKVSRAVDYSGLLSWYTDESKSREVFIVMKFGTGNDATYDYLFRKDIEDNIDSILEMMQVYTDKNNNEGDRQAAVNALNQEILNVVNKGKVKRQVVGVMDMCGTDILQRCKDAFELLNK